VSSLIHRTGLSSDYAVCVTGFAWMCSWQGAHTMSVLRRFFAMSADRTGSDALWTWHRDSGRPAICLAPTDHTAGASTLTCFHRVTVKNGA
jgi:hypothetical protein